MQHTNKKLVELNVLSDLASIIRADVILLLLRQISWEFRRISLTVLCE
jgi:hypothetical protein